MSAFCGSAALSPRPGTEWTIGSTSEQTDPQPSFQATEEDLPPLFQSFPLLIHLSLHTLNKSPESDRPKAVISSGEQHHLRGDIQTGTEFFREGMGFRRQLWMDSCCCGVWGVPEGWGTILYFPLRAFTFH